MAQRDGAGNAAGPYRDSDSVFCGNAEVDGTDVSRGRIKESDSFNC